MKWRRPFCVFANVFVSTVYGAAFAVCALACAGMNLVLPFFGDVSIWQALEYAGTPPTALSGEAQTAAWTCYALAGGVFLAVFAFHFFASGWFRRRFGIRGLLVLHGSLLIFLAEGGYATFEYADACFGIRREIRCRLVPSPLFADEFTACQPEAIAFPVKRNLVVLVGESIEEAFADGSAFGENVLPRLCRWREKHDTFGTMCSVHGCDHTICALFGMVYGTPRLPVDSVPRPVSFSDYPEAKKLPNVWRTWLANGFNCRFVKGGSVRFACTDSVFKSVPEVVVHDTPYFERDPDYLKEPEKNPFGVNDDVVIGKHLRGETLELARGGKPFVLIAWTLDTHCSGWVSAQCPRRHKDILADAAAHADDVITDYLEWLEEQPFAAQTEIVFLGDHVAHVDLGGIAKTERHPVNVLCSKTVPSIRGKRTFAAFDLAPTFLELTGAQLKDRRFGIGTSLLSTTPTLLERIGRKRYEDEIRACGPDWRRIAFGW